METVVAVLSILASMSSMAANFAAYLYHRRSRSE